MCERLREPPVGNYFDASPPTLEKMVQSLNRTELVYPPGERIKYSNAGIGVVGYVLEKTQKEPFARHVQRRVVEPLGMKKSGFEPTAALKKDLAAATMWTYHGREFPAPTFELGMAPAGSMYSTVNELARFLSALFTGGKIVKPATLDQMWTPQFAKPGTGVGFGLGFHLTRLDGRRRVGHGGAIYGFATELAALPDARLGVVVIASKDCANSVTSRIADLALRHMIAVRDGKPLPKIETTSPIPAEKARRLAGRYRRGTRTFDLSERAGKLWLTPGAGGFRAELRGQGNTLIVDDVLQFGPTLRIDGDRLWRGKDAYERVPVPLPDAPPERWRGLIGEYGWDHNILYILEKDGKLHALIEWFFLYPLTEVSENEFKFPDWGLYHDEKLVFTRDAKKRATQVTAAGVIFPRRRLDGEDGETFRVKPTRNLDDLRKEALTAQPPREKGDFRKPDLVDLTALDSTIQLDLRYASDNNFLGKPLYPPTTAYMQRPAAEALAGVNRKLKDRGYGLLIHDSYRPWYVSKMFWEATPVKLRALFVADPAQGSRHNRGCAVDLTLYDRSTGKPVPMVSGFDEFSDRSYPEYPGGTSRQRWHRDLLRTAMEENSLFSVYETEWWHYDFKEWKNYPLLNLKFEDLKAKKK